MRTFYALSLLCLSFTRADAQELTSGQATLVPGEHFLQYVGAYMDPGLTGENVVWNFTGFVGSTVVDQTFVAPTSTAFAGSFPTATVAQETGPSAWVYFQGTADAFEHVGYRDPDHSINCSDPAVVIPYPLSYGNGFSDPVECDGVTFGESFGRSGGVNVSADGFGSIVLPFGTIDNVLRVYWEESYTDVGNNVDDFGYITNYYWYKPGVHAPIFSIYHVETFNIFQEYSMMADQWSIGIAEALRNEIGLELHPNPAAEQVTAILCGKGHLRLQVIDGLGRTARSMDLGEQAPGVQKAVVDLAGLAPGAYTVRVADDRGGSGCQRLVVQ